MPRAEKPLIVDSQGSSLILGALFGFFFEVKTFQNYIVYGFQNTLIRATA